MHQSYTIRQEPDRSWSVLVGGTGTPVRLAGIAQTGLKLIEAEILLDLLVQNEAHLPGKGVPRSAYPESATAA